MGMGATSGVESKHNLTSEKANSNGLPLPLFFLAAIIIIWLGFGIRLHNLGGDSLWLDEQLTLNTARLGFPEVLTGARDHPPLTYVLISIAIKQFGENEFAARLVSLLAATLSIPLIILFGKVMRRPSAGLWAALFLAFSPFHLKYAQESRHYALLMLVSLGTYILLYLALDRPKIRYWLGFGIITAVNLYTHYGAFMVLGSQVVLIAGWMSWQLYKRNYRHVWYPILAALITILLFLPWMPYFLDGLGFNVGDSTVSDTGSLAPINEWIHEAFYLFGMYFDYLAYGIFILACFGLLVLLVQRDILTTGLLLSGIVLPFILIQVGSVARGSYARYIIYVLPLYLFAAAITPATILAFINLKCGRKLALPVTIAGVLFFVFLARRPVQHELTHIQDDWRSIVQYLDQNANEDDLLVGLSMNFANGFNTISSSLPYYLDRQAAHSYSMLGGNRLDHNSMDSLKNLSGHVWVVLYDYQIDQPLLEELGFTPLRFQTHLYVMPGLINQGTAFEQVIAVYEKLVPVADQPSPSCLLEKDLSLLYAQSGDFITAERRLAHALDVCPDLLTGDFIRYSQEEDILKVVFQGALSEYLRHGNREDAKRVANKMLQIDPHNQMALETVTVFNLLDLFENDEAVVDDEGSLEPVTRMQFLMPQTGDAGEVILTHPPSSVSFNITLPNEPAIFVSRVAMDPQSWHWGGDGSTFVVTVTTDDGDIHELTNLHVGNQKVDRQWHDIEASLAPFAGHDIVLTLSTDPGPAGDFSGDWAGWESPRIMQD